ncbi:DinB family protein [Micromonospora sp. ATA32]|nr:DinB family protein [Micromonospora sp. ATA32]
MDTNPLRQAYDALLAADPRAVPPPGEWNTEQILAHVSLVSAATISTVVAVASGAISTYDNRPSQDPWTLDRVIALAGGEAALRERIRAQGEALCALAAVLSEAELATKVPTLLLSNGACLVHQPLSLEDILAGLANVELPGHTKQL